MRKSKNYPTWIDNFTKREIKCLEDVDPGTHGFIYEIEFSNNMRYIGRKNFFHNKTLPPLKGQKRKRKKVVESDWQNYIGSIKEPSFKEGLKNGDITPIRRTILRFCNTPWEMTYYETRYLFVKNCLLSEYYYNSNILGKFYKPK